LYELSEYLPADDSLRRLVSLDRIRRLFGAEGVDARSTIVARSLHFEREITGDDANLPPVHLVTSTSREVHSRRPLDETLRTVEVAAAGLVAHGEIRFIGDEKDQELVGLCLQRLPSLGGGKSRGMGQIEISQVPCEPVTASNASTATPKRSPPKGCRLRLVLRNLEPLCLARTGFPGNIIHSESYLPGQTLRGAILTALTTQGVAATEVDVFAAPDDVAFGNGYVLPVELLPSDDAQLASLTVLPLPLTAEQVKATELPTNIAQGPWWSQAPPPKTGWLTDATRERDNLQPEVRKQKAEHPSPAAAKFKRVKSEDYLVALGDREPLRRVRPKENILMRNRTPVVRVERGHDSRRPGADRESLKQEVGDLFAQTVLVEDQLFLAEIRFANSDLAQRFLSATAAILAGEIADRAWLRVGRGGRPVRVERSALIGDDAVNQLSANAMSFTLTLTSDMIVRNEDLTFRATLDGDAVATLAGIANAAGGLEVVTRDSVTETRVVHGFNTAAGTRRAPALAIKRGSAFLVESKNHDILSRVFQALAEREAKGQGLGERQEEGFGQFVLNHRAHFPSVPEDSLLDTMPRAPSESPASTMHGAGGSSPSDATPPADPQQLARQRVQTTRLTSGQHLPHRPDRLSTVLARWRNPRSAAAHRVAFEPRGQEPHARSKSARRSARRGTSEKH
ncbi:MAG: hypothetical protein ACC645_05355, partial [Pirellulales bacterium]